MKKIAMTTTHLEVTGISNVIVNICNQCDDEKYFFSIFSGLPIDEIIKKKLKKNNINIIEILEKSKNIIKFYLSLYKGLKKEKIDIIHINANSALSLIEIIIAKITNVKKIIVHSHTSSSKRKIIHYILRPLLNILCNERIACSEAAANWMFGKNKYNIIPNSFDLNNFLFNNIARDEIRRKYTIKPSDYVIGHVGRFNNLKNQGFLIDILKEIKDESVKLLLVGDGPMKNNIKDKVTEYNLASRVIFIDETENVNKIYSAFDIFAFPSLYEGLGITIIEAQINGLQCIASKGVPQETNISDKVEFLSINKNEDKILWKNFILNSRKENKRFDVNLANPKIAKYKIENLKTQIEKIYEKN